MRMHVWGPLIKQETKHKRGFAPSTAQEHRVFTFLLFVLELFTLNANNSLFFPHLLHIVTAGNDGNPFITSTVISSKAFRKSFKTELLLLHVFCSPHTRHTGFFFFGGDSYMR